MGSISHPTHNFQGAVVRATRATILCAINVVSPKTDMLVKL